MRRTEIADGYGGITEGWENYMTVWASIEPISSNRRYVAQQMGQVLTHTIRIRDRFPIKTGWQIQIPDARLGSRLFEVISITDAEHLRTFYMSIDCREIIA